MGPVDNSCVDEAFIRACHMQIVIVCMPAVGLVLTMNHLRFVWRHKHRAVTVTVSRAPCGLASHINGKIAWEGAYQRRKAMWHVRMSQAKP